LPPDITRTYGNLLLGGEQEQSLIGGANTFNSISALFTLMWAFPFPSLEVHFVLGPFLRKQLQNDFKIEEL
jgi:hypothetical protein